MIAGGREHLQHQRALQEAPQRKMGSSLTFFERPGLGSRHRQLVLNPSEQTKRQRLGRFPVDFDKLAQSAPPSTWLSSSARVTSLLRSGSAVSIFDRQSRRNFRASVTLPNRNDQLLDPDFNGIGVIRDYGQRAFAQRQ